MPELDEIAADWCEEDGFERKLVDLRIREVRARTRGKRLLDLGCGVGILCRELAAEFDVVVGVDGSSAKLGRARELSAGSDIEFVCCLLEDFVPDGRFDTIVALNVLEHVDDPVALLTRARDWLRSTGVLIATVPNAWALHKRIGKRMGLIRDLHELTPADHQKGHKVVYDPTTFRADFEAAGLRIVELSGILLKPLASSQMLQFGDEYAEALYELGKELPEYCSSLLAVAER